jgi:hypothetical protein
VRLSGALVLAAAVIAGCGGEGPGPQDVARDFVATNSPAKCDLLAQSLVEQLTEQKGTAARDACRRNVVRYAAPKEVRLPEGEGESAGEAEREREREEAAEGTAAKVDLLVDGRETGVQLNKRDGRWLIVGLGE